MSKTQITPPRAAWFCIAFLLPLTVVIGGYFGSWAMFVVPFYVLGISPQLDRWLGQSKQNPDPNQRAGLKAHKMLTVLWAPLQVVLIFGGIYWAVRHSGFGVGEQVVFLVTIGVVTGAVGIVFAHELMHQQSRIERLAGDLLMTMVLYGHFRTEHLLVHHNYVGTPKDAVTARYNEGFHRFFPRVLKGSLISAWKAEKQRLQKRKKSVWNLKNPFCRYVALQLGFVVLAYLIAGGWGIALFTIQAFVAILYLELINYIEHYGLTREHLGDGKYEHVKPHHSWNAAYTYSNLMLINLQLHSDHHYKPSRPYPLLQGYSEDEAPHLPYGYPVMALMAGWPPLFKKVMNPRVREWRRQRYPHITDWHPYNKALNPMPAR